MHYSSSYTDLSVGLVTLQANPLSTASEVQIHHHFQSPLHFLFHNKTIMLSVGIDFWFLHFFTIYHMLSNSPLRNLLRLMNYENLESNMNICRVWSNRASFHLQFPEFLYLWFIWFQVTVETKLLVPLLLEVVTAVAAQAVINQPHILTSP